MERLNDEPDPGVRSHQYRIQNRVFHDIIHRMASSRIMGNFSRKMWDLSDFLINTTGASQPFGPAVAERNEDHRQILQALEAGDPEAARDEMAKHILTTSVIIQSSRSTSS